MTQEELAAAACLSVRAVRKIETGNVGSPRPATVRLLAGAFGLTGPDREHFHRTAAGETSRQPTSPGPPAQLPPDVSAFTGRDQQLSRLDGLSSAAEDRPTAMVISAVSGTAGVGKTALVVHWAHRVADRFPDGQLYVNLRGFDPAQPVRPAEALAQLLVGLGMPDRDIPLQLEDRAARYRTETSGRRLLIVLDNAASVEQVRPLLPGSRTCALVVTSRDSLGGLVAVDGAHRVELDVLAVPEAISLLRRLIGTRVEVEPAAAAALADQCARLPLALRIAAELAASRPDSSLVELVAELADQQRRLDLLAAGDDPRASLSAVLSWPIRSLPAEAADVFASLGLHPGPDLDPYAAAALADSTVEEAGRVLGLLARAHLVHPTTPGRFGMHDLLRAYASQRAASELSERQRHEALDRLFRYYVAGAAAAMDTWSPSDSARRPKVAAGTTPAPAFADAEAARAWLDIERPCLVAVASRGAAEGWYDCAVTLSAVLYRFLDSGHYRDALAIHGHACDAAARAGDVTGHAYSLRYLGTTHLQLGEHERAADHLRDALTRFHQTNDLAGEAAAHNMLGVVGDRRADYALAADHYERARACYREADDPYGEAIALVNLGITEDRRGCHRVAADHITRALGIFRRIGNPRGEAIALTSLGNVEERLGRYEPAAGYIRQAVARFQQLGDPQGQVRALDSLGTVQLRLGQPEQARQSCRRALTLAEEIGDRHGQAWVHNTLAEAAYAAGDAAEAVTQHHAALAVATDLGAPGPAGPGPRRPGPRPPRAPQPGPGPDALPPGDHPLPRPGHARGHGARRPARHHRGAGLRR